MNRYVLAIDTSTDYCSVALSVPDSTSVQDLNQSTIIDVNEFAPKNHARIVLSRVEQLLKEADLSLSEIDFFAFGQGPGSFTGLRIACSVIQGFGYAFNKPIVPISTLRALAQRCYLEKGSPRVFASLDARMQEVYWGLYELDHNQIMQPIIKETISKPEEIVLPELSFETFTSYPRAKEILTLALADYAIGRFVFAKDAVPLYVRDNVTQNSVK